MRTRIAFLLLLLLSLVIAPNVATAATTVHASLGIITDRTVELSWSRSGDGCFSSYTLEYKEPGDWLFNVGRTVNNPDVLSGTISGLSPGTTYVVRVSDNDCLGSSGSNQITVTTLSEIVAAGFMVGVAVVVGIIVLGIAALLWSWIRKVGRASAAAYQRGKQTALQPAPVAAPPTTPITPPIPTGPAVMITPSPEPPRPQPAQALPAINQAGRRPLPPARFCARCGAPLKGPFCGNCRFKNW